MTQIAQLSEAEIEDRFHITGSRPIAFVLAGFAKAHDAFSVQFDDGQIFLTTLLGVDAEKGRLYFDCSGSAEINHRLLAAERIVFVGRPDGIHVQFSSGAVREVRFDGDRAFSVALPKLIVRLQRRDTFRIETPRVKPLEFFGRLPGSALLKLPAHDISVAGIGLTAIEMPPELTVGQVLEACHFHLPGDSHEMYFRAAVAHVTEFAARSGNRQWRLGFHFLGLQASEQNRIQRYITHVERERHELS